MKQQQEINLRYIPGKQPLVASTAGTTGALVRLKKALMGTHAGKALRSTWYFLARLKNGLGITAIRRHVLLVERLLFLPVALVVSLILIVYLKLRVQAKKDSIDALHLGAIDHVDTLAEQYPLSLYPILYKSLQISYL